MFRNRSLTFRGSLSILPLLVMSVLIAFSLYKDLSTNGKSLIEALQLEATASQTLPQLLIQDDVTKSLLIDPLKIADLSDRKISAYDANQAAFKKLYAMTNRESIRIRIERLRELDEKKMRPLDTKILETMFDSAEEAQNLYFEEYDPLRSQYEIIVTEIIDESKRLVSEAQEEFAAETERTLIEVISIVAGGVFLVALFVFLNARSISKTLLSTINGILETTSRVRHGALEVRENCSLVDRLIVDQNSAMNDVENCCDDLKGSSGSSIEKSNNVRTLTKDCLELAQTGEKQIKTMLGAMENISVSNQNVSSDFERSNQELAKIIEIFKNIQEKTDIINSIVFQTQLLSFNASVEAARAGEHGKGFAIVAEEVGNLAKMSGDSAKAINDLLTNSTQQVQSIVVNSSKTIGQRVEEAKQHVAAGNLQANDCARLFKLILTSVKGIEELGSQASLVSAEQSTRVEQIGSSIEYAVSIIGKAKSSTSKTSAIANQVEKDELPHLENRLNMLKVFVEGKKIAKSRQVNNTENMHKAVRLRTTERR